MNKIEQKIKAAISAVLLSEYEFEADSDIIVEIPKDKYIENCSKYEWDEKDHSDINAAAKSLFGGTGFGGLF